MNIRELRTRPQDRLPRHCEKCGVEIPGTDGGWSRCQKPACRPTQDEVDEMAYLVKDAEDDRNRYRDRDWRGVGSTTKSEPATGAV